LSQGEEPVRLRLVLAFLLYRLSCGLLHLLVRAGVDDRELEIAVLRHQLGVLTRGGKRPRYTSVDRAFLAAVSRFLPKERWSAFGVVPETIRRWRRQLEARNGSRGQRGPGRPPIDPALRQLILRGKGEPPVGLPKDQGRAPQARDHRLGHDHRLRAAPGRPGAGASADRTPSTWNAAGASASRRTSRTMGPRAFGCQLPKRPVPRRGVAPDESETRDWLNSLDQESLEAVVDRGPKDRFPLSWFRALRPG
jgi:hypothetical protein